MVDFHQGVSSITNRLSTSPTPIRTKKRLPSRADYFRPTTPEVPKAVDENEAVMRTSVESGIEDAVAILGLSESERNRLAEIATMAGDFLLNRGVGGATAGSIAVGLATDLGQFVHNSNPQNQG